MPAKLDRCVEQVMNSGKDQSAAYAICTSSIYPSKDKKKEVMSAEPSLADHLTFEDASSDMNSKTKKKKAKKK